MDQLALARVLDESIAAAVQDYYSGLPREVTRLEHWQQALGDAQDDLDELRGGRSPDYGDELVALLYTIRYQLSHSNMAAAMISQALQSLRRRQLIDRRSKTLHVVDLGSGSGAMLIGAVLVAADRILHKGDIERVVVTGVEPSAPLRQMSDLVWESFRQTVREPSRPDFDVLEPLRLATERIASEAVSVESIGSVQPRPESTRWLSALHIFYNDDQQQRQVQASVSHLMNVLQPRAMFMTAHPMVQHRYTACIPAGWRKREFSPVPLFDDRKFTADNINRVARELDFFRHGNPKARQAFALWDSPNSRMDIVCLTPSQGRQRA